MTGTITESQDCGVANGLHPIEVARNDISRLVNDEVLAEARSKVAFMRQ
eukprot:CAMPEP_0185592488 /NCGR_PEP_ID=MMETSP0434-20130131/68093_1 /TAXON_ID=626734 ORGANISM="Favella taraikaensis, Strain Fe Narragansett Bay" /NCGR_SAMPLE_ID=MMETSP0434 /ASSEMBLY_ACC=CAM_ASM_000379 /LENGTH=48 /DNA_ID= /DNA_START= /DNA_END= /DNA_ORIENTATION=